MRFAARSEHSRTKLTGVVSRGTKVKLFSYILLSEAPWEDEVRKPSVQWLLTIYIRYIWSVIEIISVLNWANVINL